MCNIRCSDISNLQFFNELRGWVSVRRRLRSVGALTVAPPVLVKSVPTRPKRAFVVPPHRGGGAPNTNDSVRCGNGGCRKALRKPTVPRGRLPSVLGGKTVRAEALPMFCPTVRGRQPPTLHCVKLAGANLPCRCLCRPCSVAKHSTAFRMFGNTARGRQRHRHCVSLLTIV